MPSVTLSTGETEEIYQGNPGDVVYITTDGNVRVGKNEMFARAGRRLPADQTAEIELRESGERLFVHAEEAATVEYEEQGFFLSLFTREIVRVENSPDQPRLSSSVEVLPAESIDKQDSGIISTPANTEKTFTFSPGTGEIWELQRFSCNLNSTGGTGNHSLNVLIHDTEASFSIELLQASAGASTDINYDRGHFTSSVTSADPTDSGTRQLDAIKDIRLDDNSELRFVHNNSTDADSQFNNIDVWTRVIGVS